jgi:hypothetical protein
MAYAEVQAPSLPRPPKSAGKKAKELVGLDITFAENGYSVRCSYESPNKNGMDYPMHESEMKVFESARSLIEFLEDTLEG